MYRISELLRAGLSRVLELVGRKRRTDYSRVSCGEGCYALNDGTLVPLGDLGVTPMEYDLQP